LLPDGVVFKVVIFEKEAAVEMLAEEPPISVVTVIDEAAFWYNEVNDLPDFL